MAVRFGTFAPQGWRMDLVEIDDPVEKYEAMTAVAKAADANPNTTRSGSTTTSTPCRRHETTFECWTITATLARDTERVSIGQMVGCNGYRNPALYAKIASTVDVLSHGRLDSGIGAGWYEHEWLAYGYGFPDARAHAGSARRARSSRRCGRRTTPTFEGERYQINGAINEPKGVQKPYPSLWIGGGGEKVTLKLVAQYADACNVGGGPETCRQKLEMLRGHCETLGRNYDDIIRSSSANICPGEARRRH